MMRSTDSHVMDSIAHQSIQSLLSKHIMTGIVIYLGMPLEFGQTLMFRWNGASL